MRKLLKNARNALRRRINGRKKAAADEHGEEKSIAQKGRLLLGEIRVNSRVALIPCTIQRTEKGTASRQSPVSRRSPQYAVAMLLC